MVQQAFFHPLVNAVKFNNHYGNIFVEIKFKVFEFVRYIEFSIKDTGYGIPQEEIHQLFLAFAKTQNMPVASGESDEEDSPFTGETSGIGLGLSTTKILVEA